MSDEVKALIPLVNTSLIVISGVFLLIGYYFIRTKRVILHKRAMLTATTFAALFLVVYLTRAALLPTKVFPGEGPIRVLYFAVLISHTILATIVGPLVLVVLYRALKGQFVKHRRLARITLPIWLYVVVTGWVIYVMLYVVE